MWILQFSFTKFCVTEFRFSRFIYVTFNVRPGSLTGQVSGNVSLCVKLSVSKRIILVGDSTTFHIIPSIVNNLLCCSSQGSGLEVPPLDKVIILGVPGTPSVASSNGVTVTELFYDDDNHTLSLSGLNCRLEHDFTIHWMWWIWLTKIDLESYSCIRSL